MPPKLRKIVGICLEIWGGIRAVVDLLSSLDATRSLARTAYLDILAAPRSLTLTVTVIVTGLALLLYEPIRNWGKRNESRTGAQLNELPPHRPIVTPGEYGRQSSGLCGLAVTNPGYAAFTVHIPPVPLEPSTYVLAFPDRLTQLVERDHRRFIAAWLEHPTLPKRHGCHLSEVMNTNNIECLKFAIVYKDGDTPPLWYKSNCAIYREASGNLRVEFLGQELVQSPNPQIVESGVSARNVTRRNWLIGIGVLIVVLVGYGTRRQVERSATSHPVGHSGKAFILFGEGATASGSELPMDLFEAGYELKAYAGDDRNIATIKMKPNGHVSLDVNVADEKANSLIRIHDDEFTVASNLDRNSSDNAFEVIDADGLVIFQLKRKAPAEIVINGVFKMNTGGYFLAGPKGSLETNNVRYDYVPKPLFKYPSWRYPGKYVDEPN